MKSRTRRILAACALGLGALAAVTGDPRPDVRTQPASNAVATLAAQIENEEDHVTATELAQWIRSRRDGLRIFDVRSPDEYAAYRIPGAKHVSLPDLTRMQFRDGETIVLYSAGGAHAAQAWVLLRSRGYDEVYFLRGGLHEWIELLENDRDAQRYFGDVPLRVESLRVEEGGC